MKRFMLFGTSDEYGGGMGWEHFMGDFDTAEDAKAHADKSGRSHYATGEWIPLDHAHVIDTEGMPYWRFTPRGGWILFPDRKDMESVSYE